MVLMTERPWTPASTAGTPDSRMTPMLGVSLISTGTVERAESARGIHDRIAPGLPHHATPSHLEGAHHLPAAVGGRRAREPEGLRALDAREIDREIRHGFLVRERRPSGLPGCQEKR